jgi:hypothetical protein
VSKPLASGSVIAHRPDAGCDTHREITRSPERAITRCTHLLWADLSADRPPGASAMSSVHMRVERRMLTRNDFHLIVAHSSRRIMTA